MIDLVSLSEVYRERARLIAYLATRWPASIWRADTEWPVIYLASPAGQLSWHLSADDLDLFEHVARLPQGTPNPWDGHTTPEKYQRLQECGKLEQ